MKSYEECLNTTTFISEKRKLDEGKGYTDEQKIVMANGMYLAEVVGDSISQISTRLFRDSQGYKGLQTAIDEFAKMCRRADLDLNIG